MSTKRALGRGLNELLSEVTTPPSINGVGEQTAPVQQRLPIDVIQPGKYQPRREMDPDSLQELADSIKSQGIIQPIVVRPVGNNRYEIIAGERRWRAAQLAGLELVPVVMRDIPDEAAIAISLIENIQREDLNAIEEAMALQRLGMEFDLTHDEIAIAVGKSRAMVSNLIRLLSLSFDVKTMVERGDLEMGHARAILPLPPELQLHVAKTIIAKALSVREAESMVRGIQQGKTKKIEPEEVIDPDTQKLQSNLSEKLGAAVKIQHKAKGKGKLIISYNSLDELDGILAHIK